MVKRMSAKDARANFSEILGMVHYGNDTVIIEKQGKAVVAIIDIEQYEKWMAEREARFTIFDEIRAGNRDKGPAEIEKDVAGALAEVRATNEPERRRRAQSGR